MAILDDTRADWNARPPLRSRTVVPWAKRLGVSWHWIGPGRGPSASGPHSACLAQVREWQRQHQANTWKDIGYNALVCQHGRAIEGRGLTYSGSHSPGVNTSHVGIQFMVGSDTPGGLSPVMIARAQRLRADIGNLGKNIHRDWGHRDDKVASTECPGDEIEAWVHSGGPTANPGPRDAMRLGDRGADVEALQKALNAAGAKLTVDGSFGPATEAAVRAFQTARRLEVDGIAGPATQAALKATPAAPSASPTTTPAPAPTSTEGPSMFLVQLYPQDPVYKSDGFQRVHVTREQRDALLAAGVKLTKVDTQEALDAFGPEPVDAPEEATA